MSHPWKSDRHEGRGGGGGRKRVTFNPSYEEIPPPEYLPVNDSDEDEPQLARALGPNAPCPPGQLQRTNSTLKKKRFDCKDEQGVTGKLSVNGGRILFAPHDPGLRATYTWAVPLADITNLSLHPSASFAEYSLEFSLNDRTACEFTDFASESMAYQTLVDDAETLGFVIVLDQLLNIEGEDMESKLIASSAMLPFDDPKKKKRSSIVSQFKSKKIHRFVTHEFNLDLTYVTRRLIVMAHPGEGVKGLTWNSAKDVRRFFNTRHAHSYMVYNLNQDEGFQYDHAKFDGRVRDFGFHDHSPPPLSLIIQICHDIASFLRQSPSNIVAIHCKAGKGRSGTIACAWMLHTRMFHSAAKAIDYYTHVRSTSGKVITLPSQVRYVGYMERVVLEGGAPPRRTITIDKLTVFPMNVIKGSLLVTISQGSRSWSQELSARDGDVVQFADTVEVTEDVKLELFVEGGKSPLAVIFFNCRMLPPSPASFLRDDMDGEREYKAFKYLPPAFELTLHFASAVVPMGNNRRRSISRVSSGSLGDDAVMAAAAAAHNNSSNNDDAGQQQVPPPAPQSAGSGAVVKKSLGSAGNAAPPKIQRKSTGWVSRKKLSYEEEEGANGEQVRVDPDGEEDDDSGDDDEGRARVQPVDVVAPDEEDAPPAPV